MDDDKSVIEPRPNGASADVQEVTGVRRAPAGLSAIATPTPKGRRFGVGYRAAPKKIEPPQEPTETLDAAEERVQARKEERRKAVWDKIDAASDAADSRAKRLRAFEPGRNKP